MQRKGSWYLPLAAAAANSIAAGATLDQAIKQLPARRDVGALAYVDYIRAADLGNGLIWYPLIGIGATSLSVAAVVVGLRAKPGRTGTLALVVLAVCTVGHIAVTSRAAPMLLLVGRREFDAGRVASILDEFAALNALRAGLMVGAVVAIFWVISTTPPRPETGAPAD